MPRCSVPAALLALALVALAPARAAGQAVTPPASANLFLGPLRNFSLGLVLGVQPGETVGADDAATAGANLSFLRGAWCGGTYVNDPSARASFGLYRGADAMVYQRENY
jgi:hypothetical protein